MKSTTTELANIQTTSYLLEENASKINIGEVFSQRKGCYLNEFPLYLAHFNRIPNFIREINIDCRRANKWFVEKYKSEIRHIHYTKVYIKNSKHPEYDDIFYVLYDDLLLNFDTNLSVVRFLFSKTEISKIENIRSEIRNYKERRTRRKPEISLIINSSDGIKTKQLEIKKPIINIDENYNDDFIEVHKLIFKRLSKKQDKGIVLLHGKSGTGKTFYIRYLISILRKQVIFLPPDVAEKITSPALISLLISNPNSIFVIEDAENIVFDRECNGNSPVTALLNISDGLLSDCLNIQVICSFNTDLSKVDSALLRKGRLIANYEFKELNIEKAQYLSDKLGFNKKIESPTTLAGIYNQKERGSIQILTRNPIGFQSRAS